MVFFSKLPKIEYITPYYSLDISLNKTNLLIIMQVISAPLSTKRLLQTNLLLKKYLPSIFKNKCFNEANLSFFEEVKDTEIGHLFEHILLETIALEKVRSDCLKSTLRGKTSWNWEVDPVGKFHIRLNTQKLDKKILFDCLTKTVGLTNQIINSQTKKVKYLN